MWRHFTLSIGILNPILHVVETRGCSNTCITNPRLLYWKLEKLPYLGFTSCHEIWRGDGCWPSKLHRLLKFPDFKRMAEGLNLLNEQSLHLSNGLTSCHEIWLDEAYSPSQPCRLLKIRIFKNQDGGRSRFWKSEIAMFWQWLHWL